MARSLLKFLLLGALSTGATALPSMLGGLGGSLPLPRVASVPRSESSAELGRELAGLQDTVKQLRGLDGSAVPHIAGLSSEEQGLMRDAAPSVKFNSNTLTRKLGLAPGSRSRMPAAAAPLAARLMRVKLKAPRFQTFQDFRDDIMNFYDDHQAGATTVLWLIPAGAAALAFLLFLFKRYTLSMSLSGLLFLLANFLIWSLSAAVVMSSLIMKQNLLPALPRELWISPVVFLVVSAGLLRLADENYPFWNRTVTTLATPIAASCLAAGWGQILAGAKGLLAAAKA